MGAGLAARGRGGEEMGVGTFGTPSPGSSESALLLWPQESLLSPQAHDRACREAKVRPGVSVVLNLALAL